MNSVWNKEELPEEWKKSVIVPIYKNGDKTDCTVYKILSNILLSRKEIIGDHQCGFRRNRSITDHIFSLIFVDPCIMLNGEIFPTRCNNCIYSSQWLYSTCFG